MTQAYASRFPERWRRLKRQRVQMMCDAYVDRWKAMYRGRLSTRQRLRAAFATPLIPRYCRALVAELWRTLKAPVAGLLKARL